MRRWLLRLGIEALWGLAVRLPALRRPCHRLRRGLERALWRG